MLVSEKITFRLSEELSTQLEEVCEYMDNQGIEMEKSKVIRYLITKGIEKLYLEGKLK